MRTFFSSLITLYIFFSAILFMPLQSIFADEIFEVGTILTTTPFRFNNENWFTNPHPKIASFTVRDDRSAYGLTETGIPFSQYNIPNDADILIQRFEMQDYSHYIVDGEIVSTITELSVQLTEAQIIQKRDSSAQIIL